MPTGINPVTKKIKLFYKFIPKKDDKF